MYKTKIFIIISVALALTADLVAQEISEKEMIGFGCWYEGRRTKPVEQGLQLLSNKNLNGLRKNLNNSNSAKQFFAVLALTKLDSAGTIELTSLELEQIGNIQNSNKKIAFCSGCTAFYETTLSEALYDNSEIYLTSNFWLNRTLKELRYCKDQ